MFSIMKILISQDWANTRDNHTGISFICRVMEKHSPERFKAIAIPMMGEPKFLFFSKRLAHFVWKVKQNKIIYKMCMVQMAVLSDKDEIFLMEYMDSSLYSYLKIACKIKKTFPQTKIYGLSHLVPSKLDAMFDNCTLQKWTEPIEKILTFGHSLSKYYINRGISPNKIYTMFHPVDQYYVNDNICLNNDFVVVVMGNQMRDEDTLVEVVKNNSNIKFKIFQGMKDYTKLFSSCKNVELLPFVDEKILKSHMKSSDVSLNVMKDVVGSNIIVTSLGMGLAMVCTDTGSIRDYCSDANCFFCDTVESYSNALQKLKIDKSLLLRMKEESNRKAKDLTIDIFCSLFNSL